MTRDPSVALLTQKLQCCFIGFLENGSARFENTAIEKALVRMAEVRELMVRPCQGSNISSLPKTKADKGRGQSKTRPAAKTRR